MINANSAISFVGEAALTVYFFRRLGRREKLHAWHVAAIVLAVLLRSLLYASGIPLLAEEPLENTTKFVHVFRDLLRYSTTVMYLYGCKSMSARNLLYWAGFETVLHNAFTCVRICGFALFHVTSILGEPISATLSVLLLETLAYIVAYHAIEVRELSRIGAIRVAELVLNTALYFLIKVGIRAYRVDEEMFIILLALLSVFGLTFSLIALERNQQMRERQLRLVIEKMELKSEVNNALRAQRADENLRRLYHDMKNHLLAIQSMAGDKKELNDYLGELLPQLEEYGSQLNTGSAMIDALLGDKRERAAAVGVRFHVQLDLTPLSFMNNAELVSIFGNAVDNAVEAARECTDDDERCVYIKSRRVEDMFFLSFENHYAGERSRQAGRFRTRKADKELHGIGLGSIEKAVHKYSGEAQVSNDNATRTFRLNIMLPIQKP